MTTARNRTEPPVNRRLGFEAAPKTGTFVFKVTVHYGLWEKCSQIWPLKLTWFNGKSSGVTKGMDKVGESPTRPPLESLGKILEGRGKGGKREGRGEKEVKRGKKGKKKKKRENGEEEKGMVKRRRKTWNRRGNLWKWAEEAENTFIFFFLLVFFETT